jgi:hypothetical protein
VLLGKWSRAGALPVLSGCGFVAPVRAAALSLTSGDHRVAISLLAALISFASVLSVAIFAWINYRRERLNQRLQYVNLRQQYFAGLRVWSDQLSDLLSEAIHVAELDPARCVSGSFFGRRNALRTSISSMIDRGRWFFPNLHTEQVGNGKKAFRGYRQEVLNSLVSAYNSITALNYVDTKGNEERRKELVHAKRTFVSEIQEVLNPAKSSEEFQDITRAVAGGQRQAPG